MRFLRASPETIGFTGALQSSMEFTRHVKALRDGYFNTAIDVTMSATSRNYLRGHIELALRACVCTMAPPEPDEATLRITHLTTRPPSDSIETLIGGNKTVGRQPGDWPVSVQYSKGLSRMGKHELITLARYLISKEGPGVIVPPELKLFMKLYDEDAERRTAGGDGVEGGGDIDEGGAGAFA
jgi:hypothetical protein